MKFSLRGRIRSFDWSGSELAPTTYRGIEGGIIKFDVDKGQALFELDRRSAKRLRDDLTKLLRNVPVR